jgi:hypothetical protein
MFGLPRAIFVDNGPEFHGEALTRGCSEAKLTLAEFTEWLYLEIAGQYHHTIHRMLASELWESDA